MRRLLYADVVFHINKQCSYQTHPKISHSNCVKWPTNYNTMVHFQSRIVDVVFAIIRQFIDKRRIYKLDNVTSLYNLNRISATAALLVIMSEAVRRRWNRYVAFSRRTGLYRSPVIAWLRNIASYFLSMGGQPDYTALQTQKALQGSIMSSHSLRKWI